jgi:hypothetical protein
MLASIPASRLNQIGEGFGNHFRFNLMSSRSSIRSQSRESDMHFSGLMVFTKYSMSASHLARALEERGFDSV